METKERVRLFVTFFPEENITYISSTLDEAIACAELTLSMYDYNNYFIIKEF